MSTGRRGHRGAGDRGGRGARGSNNPFRGGTTRGRSNDADTPAPAPKGPAALRGKGQNPFRGGRGGSNTRGDKETSVEQDEHQT
jgi:hypothetical protein